MNLYENGLRTVFFYVKFIHGISLERAIRMYLFMFRIPDRFIRSGDGAEQAVRSLRHAF